MKLTMVSALAWMAIGGGCHASGVDLEAVSQAAGESARRMDLEKPIVVFGWHVEVGQDRLRWHGCTSVTACALQDRQTAAKNVISVVPAGQTTVTTPDGPLAVEVEKITLSPESEMR